ncbi:VanZ family protein [Haloferula sp. BvORR071]|uniref:VanZ family protein n=1 Tax=Haloferula sp. BvORR071 TaxID=1396141 RepID=UPI0022410133|nr:VanZ family protein [Haloferula sp. BvORR071]
MHRVLRHPLTWLAAVAVWFGVLWWLSSQSHPKPPGPEFENKDKVLHFGYFFLGGISAAAFFQRLRPAWPWERAALCSIFFCLLIGALDEWHQTHVPERSGNDAADLTADFTGAFCGALAAGRCRRLLEKKDL